MKFEKKEGKTEVDDKVEKQTKTIEKGEKEELNYKTYADRNQNFIERTKQVFQNIFTICTKF